MLTITFQIIPTNRITDTPRLLRYSDIPSNLKKNARILAGQKEEKAEFVEFKISPIDPSYTIME